MNLQYGAGRTVGLGSAIQQRTTSRGAHLICGGLDMHETEDALSTLTLGIHNILALRGDADKVR